MVRRNTTKEPINTIMKTNKFYFLFLFVVSVLYTSCIGEDIIADTVDPELRINNPLQSLAVNETYQFEATYLNNVGQEEEASVEWSSSNEVVVTIDRATGLATALQEGTSIITASVMKDGDEILIENTLEITDETVVTTMERSGSIRATSGYLLRGDFTLEEMTGTSNLRLSFDQNYAASTSLPGLYVYLTNNPNSISGAYEIGAVTTFSGAHTYEIPDVTLNQYNYVLYWCKPFSVKVGDGTIN